jgi:hypothetical protein
MRKKLKRYASVHDLVVGNELSVEKDKNMGTDKMKKNNIEEFKKIIETDNKLKISSELNDIDAPDTLESVSQVAWLFCNKLHKQVPSAYYMDSGKFNLKIIDFFKKHGNLEYRKVYSLDDYPEINYIFSYKK